MVEDTPLEPVVEAKEPVLDINSLSYSIDVKTDPQDEIKCIIGDDKDLAQFQPQVKITRWGEASSSVRLQIPGLENEVVTQEAEKIVLDKGIYSVKIYDKPEASDEGGVEFEIHLSENPRTNKFSFSVNTKDLVWWYQPPLAEGDKRLSLEEKYVGSYAVYHTSKRDHIEGQKNYATGKAFHVFRPHVVDDKGESIWADFELDKENGILTIVIDQDWLDKAVYPVVIDPTFGYTTAGVAPTNCENLYIYIYTTCTDNNAVVSKLTANVSSDTASKNFRGGIHLYSNKTLVTNGSTDEVGVLASQAWVDLPYSSTPTLSATDYLLGAHCASAGGNGFFWIDFAGDYYYGEQASTYPTVPTTVPDLSNYIYPCIYATYTVGGGGAGPRKQHLTLLDVG